MRSIVTRAYMLGLGFGNVWLVTVCIAFGLLDVIEMNTALVGGIISIVAILLLGGAALFLSIRFLRLGFMLPKPEAGTDAGTISVSGRRIFGALILVEIIGWTILNILLGRNQLQVWIVPADLFLIGAHFIPLAFVFKVPAYLVMGILWLVAIIGSLLFIPSTLIIGHSSAWTTIPSLCCVIITCVTSFYLTTMGRRILTTALQIA